MTCCKYDPKKDTLEVEAYSSYNSIDLPTSISLVSQISSYDSSINYASSLIGLPNTDIEIQTISIYGAFSVINKQSQRRFFLYSPVFFDSVYKVTQTNLAVLSICFHELAHQFYRHPLKSSYASHFYEKQADRYSGFEMCIIGATLEQSLTAMKNFGNDAETPTHPDKSNRLAEIEKGYIDAKIKIFKDSSYMKQDRIFKSQELMYALFDDKSLDDIQSMKYSKDTVSAYTKSAVMKSNTKQIYSFYGELIYLTKDNQIKLVSNNETIGNVFQLNSNIDLKVISLDGVKFYLEGKTIFSVNPDGFKLEVGNKITN